MAERVQFTNFKGQELAGLLDVPDEESYACSVFAHCFTCSKEINAAATISQSLASTGIATLRFDFTGLGESEGTFSQTNFSTNISDLASAAHYLTGRFNKPLLLVGHSLGGTAAIAVASQIPQARAVVTLGSPFDPAHVSNLLGDHKARIQEQGIASVRIAGRTFEVTRQFLEDIASHKAEQSVAGLKRPLLILHSTDDEVVSIDNAELIFDRARHPKSFVDLDGMDHLIQSRLDRQYVGELIATWAKRYLR